MLHQAERILRELGVHLLEWRAMGLVQGEWIGAQLKAEADKRAHEFLVDRLTREWPTIPVVSEEDPDSQISVRPPMYWLIDPIDGTASYCGGYAGFVTQVALIRDAAPVLGIVHGPALDLTWRAEDNQRSERNGAPIAVEADPLARTFIDNYPEPRGIAREVFEDLRFTKYVESGSIGLKICRVADGTATAFVKDVVVREWDLAPADLILRNAGGHLSDFAGKPIVYAGSMERMGIIATSSRALMDEIVAWRSDRRRASD